MGRQKQGKNGLQDDHRLAIYQKIFDTVTEEIMLLDRDLKIIWANGKVKERYQKNSDAVCGEFCHRVTHGLEHVCRPPHDICPIDEVLRSGEPTTVLHTHFDKQGERIYAEVTAYPVYENDEIREFIHISRDVTERIMAEERLKEQQQAIMELSTPVVKLWEGILTLPLIGIIDSTRARMIMESLLETIVETQAGIAIIDITGVPMVDTEVADRLIRTMKAAALLGTHCIMVGIKPDIAQSIVQLGVDLKGFETYATLQAGLEAAFRKIGLMVRNNE